MLLSLGGDGRRGARFVARSMAAAVTVAARGPRPTCSGRALDAKQERLEGDGPRLLDVTNPVKAFDRAGLLSPFFAFARYAIHSIAVSTGKSHSTSTPFDRRLLRAESIVDRRGGPESSAMTRSAISEMHASRSTVRISSGTLGALSIRRN